jgi:hypothetical protein
MKTDKELAKDESAPASFSRPKVVTQFTAGYVPQFDVVATVEKMLDSVPPKFLSGLGETVLTNTASLPRKLRRSITKSRGRKVHQAECGGLYFKEWNGRPAWIKIFVDNTLSHWHIWFWNRHFFTRDIPLGRILFHEIGHHIHATLRPEHREREDVADDWRDKLQRNYVGSRYPWLRFVSRLLRPQINRYVRSKAEKLYKAGVISRREYEKSMKD